MLSADYGRGPVKKEALFRTAGIIEQRSTLNIYVLKGLALSQLPLPVTYWQSFGIILAPLWNVITDDLLTYNKQLSVIYSAV